MALVETAWAVVATVCATVVVGTVKLVADLFTRVSVLETKVENFDHWLSRIEDKLDRVIEHDHPTR